MFYAPRQHGITGRTLSDVMYTEASPSIDMTELVFCFWELKTDAALENNFRYAVIPDACVDIVFDLNHAKVFAMTPHIISENIDLGTDFHFVGIRLHPGVYAEDLTEIIGGAIDIGSLCGERILGIVSRLVNMTFTTQQRELAKLVQKMADAGAQLIHKASDCVR